MITREQLWDVRDFAKQLTRDELSSPLLKRRAETVIKLVHEYDHLRGELEETQQDLRDVLNTLEEALHG